MFQELFSHVHIAAPMFALALFLISFVGIIVRTYGRKAASYSVEERLPLDDESDPTLPTGEPVPALVPHGGRRG